MLELERRVIVHSIHSQVCKTLQRLDIEPDLVVAFDSHIDWFWGTKDIIESMPKQMRLVAARASAHTLIRRAIGELPMLMMAKGLPVDSLPEMILVIPEICLHRHIREFSEWVGVKDPLKTFLGYLSKFSGIKVFTSPPKNVMKLKGMLREAECSVLDLDIDYLWELQTECYMPIGYAQRGQLGRAIQMLRLIRKTKPQVITISEVKVTAVQDPKSTFSRFLNPLKNLGYKISRKIIFDNDEDAERLIRIYQGFYEGVQKPLQRKQRMEPDYLSGEAFERHHKELKEAARRYFRHHK